MRKLERLIEVAYTTILFAGLFRLFAHLFNGRTGVEIIIEVPLRFPK